jgi:hypothetical protein
MPNRRKVNFQGRMVDAEVVDFEADKEQWSTYILHDGSSLKVKAVVTEVARLEGVYDQKGDPVYMIQASQIMHVNAPDALRRSQQ